MITDFKITDLGFMATFRNRIEAETAKEFLEAFTVRGDTKPQIDVSENQIRVEFSEKYSKAFRESCVSVYLADLAQFKGDMIPAKAIKHAMKEVKDALKMGIESSINVDNLIWIEIHYEPPRE